MSTSSESTSSPGSSRREHISCPGCGRHDWVTWPAEQDTYPWKCFNCEKRFDLQRPARH